MQKNRDEPAGFTDRCLASGAKVAHARFAEGHRWARGGGAIANRVGPKRPQNRATKMKILGMARQMSAIAGVWLALMLAYASGLRINTSRSLPMGLYLVTGDARAGLDSQKQRAACYGWKGPSTDTLEVRHL
jgi:hypothetical protein